jgi:FkbM family methyltransferase
MMRRLLRSLGFDIVRYPRRHSLQWDVMRLFERYGVNCVLDVGANDGQYARCLRNWGYRGDIVSFEPVPEVFEALQKAMAGDRRWQGYPWALGDADEEAEINVAGGDAQASSFLAFKEDGAARWGRAHRVVRSMRVPVRRLDSVLGEVTSHVATPRIYLKLDTQGFDLRVIAGAGDRLGDVLALQTELAVHHFYEGMVSIGDALNQYRDLGYALTGMHPVARELDGMQVIEFDCVMVRPDWRDGGRRLAAEVQAASSLASDTTVKRPFVP